MDREPEGELLRKMSPRTGALVDYIIASKAREEARRREVVDDVLSRTGLSEEDLIEPIIEHPRMAALLAQAVQGGRIGDRRCPNSSARGSRVGRVPG